MNLRHLSKNTTLILTGLAIGAVTAGGAAQAATGNSTAQPTKAAHAAAAGHGRAAKADRGGLAAHALHGEFVVPVKGQSGTYQTVDVARGTVQSVSASSLTVQSPDGTSLTFTVTADTKFRTGHGKASAVGDLAVGDKVQAVGVKVNGTLTAREVGKAPARTGKPGSPAAQPTQPAPGASPTA